LETPLYIILLPLLCVTLIKRSFHNFPFIGNFLWTILCFSVSTAMCLFPRYKVV
jgi:hypothetical protein